MKREALIFLILGAPSLLLAASVALGPSLGPMLYPFPPEPHEQNGDDCRYEPQHDIWKDEVKNLQVLHTGIKSAVIGLGAILAGLAGYLLWKLEYPLWKREPLEAKNRQRDQAMRSFTEGGSSETQSGPANTA